MTYYFPNDIAFNFYSPSPLEIPSVHDIDIALNNY